ncbi:MAG: ORF6N domain-containing protein [Proteobacteria bacterium]|nr:ORF6N domain-containing protein [Pseudomonadota bacterium]
MQQKEGIIPSELIASKIYIIRRLKVMLDRDLAALYGIETKVLKQAVRRNIKRFPGDFMFELSKQEFAHWRSQFVTSKKDKIGLRYSPMAFTEQGVAMLSSVLNSERAIEVNIQIMRVFTRFRQILLSNKDLRRELEELKRVTDDRFRVVFETLDQLLSHEERPKRKIGFKVEEKAARYRVTKRSTKSC